MSKDRLTLLDLFNSVYEEESLSTILHAHKLNHEGRVFGVGYRYEGVADEAAVNFYIATGSDNLLHGSILIKATGRAYIDIQEDGEYSGGTAVTAVANNRSSTLSLDSTFKRGVTIDTPGDAVSPDLIPGSASPARSDGGDARPGIEFIGAVDSEYVIVITNKSGGAADIMVKLEVYEDE
jgi:hypothetical protein